MASTDHLDCGALQFDTADDTPVLRDLTFGQSHSLGGETPFRVDGCASHEHFDADVEGIPTGLPDLLDLDAWPATPLTDPEDELATEPVRRESVPEPPVRARRSLLVGAVGVLTACWSVLVLTSVV